MERMTEVRLDPTRMRTLREARGWSQEHLAAVSGLSARTIQRIESDGGASKESRMALAAAFDVDAAELVWRPEQTGATAAGAPHPTLLASQRTNQVLWAISLTMLAVAMSYAFGKDVGDKLNQTCEIPAAERR